MLTNRFFVEENGQGPRFYIHYYKPTEFDPFYKIQYGYDYELTQRSAFHTAKYAILDLDADNQTFTFKNIPEVLKRFELDILAKVQALYLKGGSPH
jgi:hypothetical protein